MQGISPEILTRVLAVIARAIHICESITTRVVVEGREQSIRWKNIYAAPVVPLASQLLEKRSLLFVVLVYKSCGVVTVASSIQKWTVLQIDIFNHEEPLETNIV